MSVDPGDAAMRDRGPRLLIVLVILALPLLIVGAASLRSDPSAPSRSAQAATGPGPSRRVETAEAAVVAGLFLAGRLRRRLLAMREADGQDA
jgi:hypothetical protein